MSAASRPLDRPRAAVVVAVAVLLLGLGLVRSVQPAGAGTIASVPVTKKADTNDGECTITDCSLREAVGFANAQDTNQINVPAGRYRLTRVADGDLQVTGDLTIVGVGAKKTIIDANGIDRAFHVTSGVRLTLIDLTVTGGRPAADGGGGVWSQGGTVKLVRAAMRGNRAGTEPGGGILAAGGKVVLDRSTLSGNGTGVQGGGVAISGGRLTIRHSTISGNSAGDAGGGIHVDGTTTSVQHATFAKNEAGAGGGAIHVAGGQASVEDSIVASSRGRPNCAGTVVSGGHNVDDGWSCGFTKAGDRRGSGPRIKSLGYYGGGTMTHALRASSPARGRAGSCKGTDQRGAPRGKPCDSGAYEYVTCRGRPVNVLVPNGEYRVNGTRKADVILGTGQGNVIHGKGGPDRICGRGGIDQLFGDAGDDVLDGGPLLDWCTGGTGRDVAYNCESRFTIP